MTSPYKTRVQFLMEGTEDEVFHEMAGPAYTIVEDDIINLNDVAYKVEDVQLYLYDMNYTNPTSGVDQWSMDYELYKVYLTVV